MADSRIPFLGDSLVLEDCPRLVLGNIKPCIADSLSCGLAELEPVSFTEYSQYGDYPDTLNCTHHPHPCVESLVLLGQTDNLVMVAPYEPVVVGDDVREVFDHSPRGMGGMHERMELVLAAGPLLGHRLYLPEQSPHLVKVLRHRMPWCPGIMKPVPCDNPSIHLVILRLHVEAFGIVLDFVGKFDNHRHPMPVEPVGQMFVVHPRGLHQAHRSGIRLFLLHPVHKRFEPRFVVCELVAGKNLVISCVFALGKCHMQCVLGHVNTDNLHRLNGFLFI